MTKATTETSKDLPNDALLLECNTDRYKLAYAAIRWAKELKTKENSADSIPVLVQRALREILTGKILIADIQKLPVIVRVAAPPPPPPPPPTPTLTLNVNAEGSAEGF